MKRIALVLTALGALSVVTTTSAQAHGPEAGLLPAPPTRDFHSRLHDELEHRAFHRELDHREAHRHPMTWQQHGRLHDHLEHEAFHDQLAHRAGHRAIAPRMNAVAPRMNRGLGIGRAGVRGFAIQTPGFSFRIGR